ncbi:hypothetical protein SD71_08095 [Cohnella kolymensis]|uniref:Uncharacterized protein n=1 Tax=Cohnella kolymensis TaxID=1590652 RepID=A0ABR5A6H5_9BACL|nr:hypothetical protein SD71_08095 [Cohnella kolymensis]
MIGADSRKTKRLGQPGGQYSDTISIKIIGDVRRTETGPSADMSLDVWAATLDPYLNTACAACLASLRFREDVNPNRRLI